MSNRRPRVATAYVLAVNVTTDYEIGIDFNVSLADSGAASWRHTSDGRIDGQHVGLFTQQLCALFQYPQGLVFCEPALAIEVVFEERYIRLGLILASLVEKLLW